MTLLSDSLECRPVQWNQQRDDYIVPKALVILWVVPPVAAFRFSTGHVWTVVDRNPLQNFLAKGNDLFLLPPLDAAQQLIAILDHSSRGIHRQERVFNSIFFRGTVKVNQLLWFRSINDLLDT